MRMSAIIKDLAIFGNFQAKLQLVCLSPSPSLVRMIRNIFALFMCARCFFALLLSSVVLCRIFVARIPLFLLSLSL